MNTEVAEVQILKSCQNSDIETIAALSDGTYATDAGDGPSASVKDQKEKRAAQKAAFSTW